MSAIIASGIDLYGTFTSLMSALDSSSLAPRSEAVPIGPVEKLSRPGLAFARAIKSCSELTADDEFTTRMQGVVLAAMIGIKSFTGSAVTLGCRYLSVGR